MDKSVILLCDDIAQLIGVHGEAATLGDGLLAIKRTGSSKGLATLAIVTDFARVCDLVIRTAPPPRPIQDSLAFPIIRLAANRLARSGRKQYRQFIQLAPEHLNRFLTVYRRDAGWFGTACVETTWSGLEICRKCADRESDVDILQRYVDIANGLIAALLGPSKRPLAIRAFVTFLDGTVAEVNSDVRSDGPIQAGEAASDVAEDVAVPDHVDDGNTKEIRVEWAGTKRDVCITLKPISVPIVFDVHEAPEMISIVLNSQHPLSTDLFASMNGSNGHKNGHVSPNAVHVLLEAWARLESLSGDRRRQLLEDIRLDWGRIARDILSGDLSGKQ